MLSREEVLSEIRPAVPFRIVYVKKDGSTRSAKGVIPVEHEDNYLKNDHVRYFDLGIMGFRSFRVDRVVNVLCEPSYRELADTLIDSVELHVDGHNYGVQKI